MIYLEIAMILIGLGAIIYGTRLSDSKQENIEEATAVPKADDISDEKVQDMLQSFSEKAQDIYEDTEEKLGQLSNEKIMGISEYSDQILEKMITILKEKKIL